MVVSIICDKCGSKDGKIFKEGQSIEILKIDRLVPNKYIITSKKKNGWRKHNQELRLKNYFNKLFQKIISKSYFKK